MVWKTLVAQQRTNAQLNSHMALAGNRTGVTLVRGERFTLTIVCEQLITNESLTLT